MKAFAVLDNTGLGPTRVTVVGRARDAVVTAFQKLITLSDKKDGGGTLANDMRVLRDHALMRLQQTQSTDFLNDALFGATVLVLDGMPYRMQITEIDVPLAQLPELVTWCKMWRSNGVEIYPETLPA